MTDPAAREREVIALLEEWPWESGTTVIGGYALAAYGAARHSEDIDFTLASGALPKVVRWLEQRGFARKSLKAGAFPNALRFERDPVSIDLLVGFVRDREAHVDIPEPWIGARPHNVRLDLLTGRVNVRVRVARPEALWALKLQSGRAQDLTDLFAIATEPVDPAEVRSLFRVLMTPSLAKKLERVVSTLDSRKIYNDSRSRLHLQDDAHVRARWSRFRQRASNMVPQEP